VEKQTGIKHLIVSVSVIMNPKKENDFDYEENMSP
jgi:hypothetical protein